MKKSLLIILILFSFVTFSNAQVYKTGIGVRGGLFNGITIKHFIGEQTAVEGILSTRWRGFNMTGLYEKHKNAFDIERLSWYYGFGGHIGFWNGNNVKWVDDNNDYTVIGIDGILGLEYTFDEIPINLSIDWKPAINIIGHSGFWGDAGAVSIRYTF